MKKSPAKGSAASIIGESDGSAGADIRNTNLKLLEEFGFNKHCNVDNIKFIFNYSVYFSHFEVNCVVLGRDWCTAFKAWENGR